MPGSYQLNAEDIRLATNPALEVSSGGLRVKVVTDLERVAGGLRIAAAALDGNSGLQGAGGALIALKLSDRMEFSSGALRAKTKASEGLGQDSNGYFVDKTQAYNWTGAHDFSTGGGAVTVKTPTLAGHAANKSYVDGLAALSVSWKETLLGKIQLITSGFARATAFWMGQPISGDFLVIKSSTQTRTYGFGVGGDVTVAIGVDAQATMINLATAITNDAGGEWTAPYNSSGLRKLNNGATGAAAGAGLIISRKDADNTRSDRIYGTFATPANAAYVNYAGTTDYSKTTSSQLPGADPGTATFGVGRSGPVVGETHSVALSDAIFIWDADANGGVGTWQQLDAGVIQGGAGMVKNGSILDIQAADASMTINADNIAVKLSPNKGISLDGGNGLQVTIDNSPNPSLAVGAGGLSVKMNSAGGISVGASGIGIKLAANAGLGFDGGGNLTHVLKPNEGLGVDASGLYVARADNSLQSGAGGVSVKLSANKGLSLDGANGLQVNPPGNGLTFDGSGTLQTVLDTGSSGQLSKSGSGLRVATGGVGLPVAWQQETYAASAFTYNGGSGLSTINVLQTPSTHGNIKAYFSLVRITITTNAMSAMFQVGVAPSAAGEWRLNGNVLEIYGDITAQNDTYRVYYTSNV